MGNKQEELHAWAWRVRRDILALEYVSRCHSWRELEGLFAHLDLPNSSHPLPPEESLEVTKDKVTALLRALPYGDPGEPPLPPLD